jgi:hypothetical protein
LAIVVSSSSSFDNARYYEKIAQENFQDIIVFNSLRTAEIWLGVDAKDLMQSDAKPNSEKTSVV